MIFFFDTSALIKRYLHEKGSARVRRLLQTGNAIFYQTFLTPLEITSAFYRQHRGGQLSIEALSLLLKSYAVHSRGEYLLVPHSESLTDLAVALISRHPLRVLDAIQLASALMVRNALPPGRPSAHFSFRRRPARYDCPPRTSASGKPETFPLITRTRYLLNPNSGA